MLQLAVEEAKIPTLTDGVAVAFEEQPFEINKGKVSLTLLS